MSVAANMKLSMGAVEDCYDNAMAESLFASLETELIDRQPRQRFRTRAEASREVFCYLEGFYNPRRVHSALDYQSPVAYERRYVVEQGFYRKSQNKLSIKLRLLQSGLIDDSCTWKKFTQEPDLLLIT